MKISFEKGITLIALVITIILLLILAGVTLNIVFNGELIEKSQTAVDKYSEEQAKEKLILDVTEYKMGKITGEYGDFEEYIENIKDGIVDADTENDKYKVKLYGYEFILDKETLEIEDGNKGETQVTPQEPVTPEPPQEPEVTDTPIIIGGNNLIGTTNGTKTGGEYTYANPVIPVGFKILETTDASWEDADSDGKIDGWNNGLVITDAETDGNEFVWVPIDKTNISYTRKLFSKNYVQVSSVSVLSDDMTAIPVDNELYQIEKYGGFYIARYEASQGDNNIPQTQYDKTPWVEILYDDAKEYAKSYKQNNEYVLSGLLTGRMWDSIMIWVAGGTTDDKLSIVQTDSSSWGNCETNLVANTGAYTSKNVKKKNIYDLAGNVWEWTSELVSSNPVKRSGSYANSGLAVPASYRTCNMDTPKGKSMGFRVCLFIL